MTANESVELLFRARMEGQADIDKMAASVKGIESSAIASAESIASLEKAIAALTQATHANTSALNEMASAGDRVKNSMSGVAGGARAITNEFRVMEGAMPIRAAAQFLSQIQGINALAGTLFPIFGAIAMVGVLEQIVTKVNDWAKAHDPVLMAQKASIALLDEEGKRYDELTKKLRALNLERIERTQGRDARQRAEIGYDRKDQADAEGIQRELERQLREVTMTSRFHMALPESGAAMISQFRVLSDALGIKTTKDKFGFEDVKAGQPLTAGQIASIQQYGGGLQGAIGIAQQEASAAQMTAEGRQGQINQAGSRNADQIARWFAGALGHGNDLISQSQDKWAAAAMADEKNPFIKYMVEGQKIQAKTNENLEKLTQQIAEENARRREEHLPAVSASQTATLRGQIVQAGALAYAANDRERQNAARLFTTIEDPTHDHLDRLIQEGFFPEAREGGLSEVNGNKLLASIFGGLTGAGPILGPSPEEQLRLDRQSTTARLAQARSADRNQYGGALPGLPADIYGIQQQSNEQEYQDQLRINEAKLRGHDLELANEDALQTKKEKDFQAQLQFEDSLQAQREKDLEKYRGMAESLFGAIKGHSLNQWGRNFLNEQEGALFSNATAPVLQNVGHLLGGLTGGANPGGLLTGTIFDPANAGTPTQATAHNTKGTWDEVKALRTDIARMFTGGGGSSASIGPLAGGPADLFNLPLTHNPLNNLALFGSDVGGFTGTAGLGLGSGSAGLAALLGGAPTSLYNSYGGNGLQQFFGGIGAGGNNPLGAIFTGQANGNGWSANLTGAQQAGVAVSTGVGLAGAGLGIVSGIEQGGVGGVGKAVSSGLGAAAMLDPDPLSKSILGAAAAITGLVTGMFANGPQQRQQQIQDYLAKNAYLAPTALNVMQSPGGTYASFDARGNLETSTMSAIPTVAEPYITKQTINGQQGWYDAPGYTTSPYSGGPKGTGQTPVSNGPTIIIQGGVQAIDSQSFHDFATKASSVAAIGAAATLHLQSNGGERFADMIKFHANG